MDKIDILRDKLAAEITSRRVAQIYQADLQERIKRADLERQAAVRAEREACAELCDGYANCEGVAQKCAQAIRERK